MHCPTFLGQYRASGLWTGKENKGPWHNRKSEIALEMSFQPGMFTRIRECLISFVAHTKLATAKNGGSVFHI